MISTIHDVPVSDVVRSRLNVLGDALLVLSDCGPEDGNMVMFLFAPYTVLCPSLPQFLIQIGVIG